MPNRVVKLGASGRDPALHGFCKCSHIDEYAALSKTPRALADGPMLVFQHSVKRILCGVILALLTGCMTVGPDYKRPSIDTPAVWRTEESEARDLANTAWWEQFNDPVLNGLVATALQENKDLLIATARIEEFFGRYFSTRGDQFPSAGGNAGASRQRLTEKNSQLPIDGKDNPFNYYQAFLGASWEIDFWGKYRRATEAARAELLGTEEARRTVVLTLVSAVAAAYVDIRALDKQLAITQSTAESRKATLELFKMRFRNGIISEVDLSQAESEYEDAMARIPDAERAIGHTENALSVLLGRNPGPIPRGLTLDELILPAVPAGVPSDLLERRPDIRQAEQLLIAANARIGVAKSLYFPTISLTGAFGTASTDLSNLFSAASRTWNFGVPVSVPLFTAGRIGGEVKAAEASQQQAVYSYQQTIQNAFREVDDALIDRSKSRQRLDALNRQLDALHNYARLARMRYDEGYTSYLEVLDAERSLFNVELSHTTGQNVLFRSLIGIYKSMGGGWVTKVEDRMPAQPVMEAGFIP
jgi:multidrug efflux system outer membrane protein